MACCTAPLIVLPLMLKSRVAVIVASPVTLALAISCKLWPELIVRLPACRIGLPKAANVVGVCDGSTTERSIDTLWNTGASL